MSLILEALKKLDREKAFIRKVTANIADEILKSDPVRPRKRFPLYFAAVLLTVCVTATLTYVVITNLGFLAKTALSPSPNPPGASPPIESSLPFQAPVKEAQEAKPPLASKDQNLAGNKIPSGADPSPAQRSGIVKQPGQRVESFSPPREPEREDQDRSPFPSSKGQIAAEGKGSLGTDPPPVPKPTVAKQPAPGVEIPPPPEPARQAQEGPPPSPVKDRNPAESRQASPLPVEKKGGQNIGAEGAGGGSANAKKAAEDNLSKSGTPLSSFRLTGIVWTENPSGRYAVINGAILTEGAEIQGVKVVEILPNRVRLMDNGRPFEIQLF